MKIPTLIACLGFVLSGCDADHKTRCQQRFVLVPNPSQINKDIPAGALALDTQTGQLCYTVGGPYTSEFPNMSMCLEVYKLHPDSE
jgi:hypothetical protein